MYALDTTPFVKATASQLSNLPLVGNIVLLVLVLWLVSDSTRFIIEAVKSKWLKPRAATVWTLGLTAIGYSLGGTALAALTFFVATWSLLASISVRRFMLRLQFYRYVKEQLAKRA